MKMQAAVNFKFLLSFCIYIDIKDEKYPHVLESTYEIQIPRFDTIFMHIDSFLHNMVTLYLEMFTQTNSIEVDIK